MHNTRQFSRPTAGAPIGVSAATRHLAYNLDFTVGKWVGNLKKHGHVTVLA
jgi:hypothetical protein